MGEIETPHHNKPTVGPSGRTIIYDEDGKPCRSCNTLLDFKSVKFSTNPTKKSNPSTVAVAAAVGVAATTTTKAQDSPYPKDCPADVAELGRSSWTLLHTISARYPKTPSAEQQTDMVNFIGLFSKLYPCWFCAKDFQNYIQAEETKPRVKTQEEFGRWLCDAHNEVNSKLGKPKFDCNLWKQRWKDGWDDGSCD